MELIVMTRYSRVKIVCGGLAVLLILNLSLSALQSVPDGKPPEAAEELITAGPKDLKERIGIIVFLAWIWSAIFVLIIFLCQKISEADRLHQQKFYDSPKGKRFIHF
jgi:hypothetical protein